MLLIEKIFNELNFNDCNYFLYKGYHHLIADIESQKGDIDLYVERSNIDVFERVIFEFGFVKALNRNTNSYQYYSRYPNDNVLMLDVIVNLPYLDQDEIPHLKVVNGYLGVRCLSNEDMLSYGILQYLNNGNIEKENDFLRYYKKDLLNLKFKESFIYKKHMAEIDRLTSSLQSSEKLIKVKKIDFNYLFSRILGFPNVRAMRKGKIIAIVGVDGAGKSTVINSLKSNHLYKLCGIKSYYMGGKNFWIPGIEKFKSENKYLSLSVNFVKSIDRQLRVIPALYYRSRGYIVLCDRYFYDDEIDAINRKRMGGFSRIQQIFKPKIRVIPDRTFYLDVSPEVAHSRKIEYSFESMVDINSRYVEYMSKKSECIFIDANQNANKVLHAITSQLDELISHG